MAASTFFAAHIGTRNCSARFGRFNTAVKYNKNKEHQDDCCAIITPKAFHAKAQGRPSSARAHPGYANHQRPKPQRGLTIVGDQVMPQSLVQIYVHIVFSTKNREPFLIDRQLRHRTHAYLHGICANQGSPSIRIGGVEDHVHILCRLSKTLDVSTFIRELKRDSSKWVKDQKPELTDFYWQNGYGAFSVSPSHVDPLTQYIVNQEEHHRHARFQGRRLRDQR